MAPASRFQCRGRPSSDLTWSLIYAAGALLLALGYGYDNLWVCGIAFAATSVTLVIHIVRASLTRRLYPLRLLIGLNVVVLAAAALGRDQLSTLDISAIVVGIPMLSYYCYWGYTLALAPPRTDEALRPPKELKDCHLFNKVTLILVTAVEFVQFNALAFNPALGAWQQVHGLTERYSTVFLVMEEVTRWGSNQAVPPRAPLSPPAP